MHKCPASPSHEATRPALVHLEVTSAPGLIGRGAAVVLASFAIDDARCPRRSFRHLPSEGRTESYDHYALICDQRPLFSVKRRTRPLPPKGRVRLRPSRGRVARAAPRAPESPSGCAYEVGSYICGPFLRYRCVRYRAPPSRHAYPVGTMSITWRRVSSVSKDW